MTNPILIELTRGSLVESVHTGALAIARSNGELVVSLGDIAKPVFPRSAIKAFQALPLLETGAADRYGFGNREIALACASHSGTVEHAELAASMLTRAGHDLSALGCGAQPPTYDDAAFELRRAGLKPTALNNNCSGKHAGMVATCTHCGDPVAGYCNPSHPHQRRIAQVLEDFTQTSISRAPIGVDGCSAPNWAIPLAQTARAFATFITGNTLSVGRAEACRRIATACMAESNLVAGPGRLDTRAMTAFPSRIFMKTGAEGVYCGAFPALGVGFALKVDDGNTRASQAVTESLLQHVFGPAAAFGCLGPIRNWRGTETGVVRASEVLVHGLERLSA